MVFLAVLDQKFEEKLGTVGKGYKKKDHADSQGETKDENVDKVDEEVDKLEDKDEKTQEKEQQKQTPKKHPFAESFQAFEKVCCLFYSVITKHDPYP